MPLIAMTREMGSLGKDVAAAVAQELGKPVVHHEMIDHLASKMRLRKSHVARFLEGKSNIFERMVTDETSLSIYTADEIFQLAENGEAAVVRGWGATQLFREVPHVITVRVCAPVETRIARMKLRLDTEDEDAIRGEIDASDEAQGAIMRRHFGINWREAEHYDLSLNTGRVSVEECADQVMKLVRHPAFQETESSRSRFHNLALAARVRAALRADARTAKMQVNILADDGRVTLSGELVRFEEPSHAEEVTAAVPGVDSIDNRLRYRTKRVTL